MDKQVINQLSLLVALESIPKAKKGETLAEFVQRAYPEFEKTIANWDNSQVKELQTNSEKLLHNAISKLEARRVIVQRYCAVNDPFDVKPPEEATDKEILEHNGIDASVEEMKKVLGGEEQFQEFLKKYKTPKKDGHTQTEIREMEIEHYSKYEPVFPSEKEYTHSGGGTTRDYHWQSSLKDEFVIDHQNFLSEYGLTDSFPKGSIDDLKHVTGNDILELYPNVYKPEPKKETDENSDSDNAEKETETADSEKE